MCGNEPSKTKPKREANDAKTFSVKAGNYETSVITHKPERVSKMIYEALSV
jgi:hypothetical protein